MAPAAGPGWPYVSVVVVLTTRHPSWTSALIDPPGDRLRVGRGDPGRQRLARRQCRGRAARVAGGRVTDAGQKPRICGGRERRAARCRGRYVLLLNPDVGSPRWTRGPGRVDGGASGADRCGSPGAASGPTAVGVPPAGRCRLSGGSRCEPPGCTGDAAVLAGSAAARLLLARRDRVRVDWVPATAMIVRAPTHRRVPGRCARTSFCTERTSSGAGESAVAPRRSDRSLCAG